MIRVYTQLRDLHTNYILPQPFRTRVAVVPFRIEDFFEDGKRRYVVTQVSPTVGDAQFKAGVVVTHWNHIPIDRAVEVNAEREAGSNLDARHARGLSAMTIRWMAMSLPPDEEQVTLQYLTPGGAAREARFAWQVLEPDAPASGTDLLAGTGPEAILQGIDAKVEVERRVLKLLFAPEAMAAEREMAALAAMAAFAGEAGLPEAVDLGATSTLPDVFSDFRAVATPHGTFAYLRIRTFNVLDVGAFLQELIRILALLPQEGLILDVRGNGGGHIMAGERMLQLLTPRPIDPARFHFINSQLTLTLCENDQRFQPWRESIAQSIETGTTFSQGFSLLPIEQYNDIGQKYQGPAVLVTDALCYSTTDIFAAGFQDHGIGKILGTSGNTGAGGANVWAHDLLRSLPFGTPSPFRALPKGTSFRVAVRRVTRVGERAGAPIEDLGIVPDEQHRLTRNDVLNKNEDLIARAAVLLAGMRAYHLAATAGTSNGKVEIAAKTRNLGRLDVLLEGRPRLTLDVIDGTTTFELPGVSPGTSGLLELRGYDGRQLAAATRLAL
jgi:hypothetical protein